MPGFWRHTMDWFEQKNLNVTGGKAALRTVDNPKTGQHEELPLPEFQRLLRQGRIEATETYSPYNGHEQTVYRLV